jgi:hypothetical protein
MAVTLIVAARLQTTPALFMFTVQMVNVIIVHNKLPGLLTPRRIFSQKTLQERCRRCPYKAAWITQVLKQTSAGIMAGHFRVMAGQTERGEREKERNMSGIYSNE